MRPVPAWSRRRWLQAAGLAGSVPALAGLAACGRAPFQSIDLTGADYGRDFKLLDSDGRMRTLADFRGQVVLLFFGFTQCPDVCPTALSRAVQVMKALGPQAARVQVLFVTIDPERDTPALLREYMQAFDARFVGLHGDEAATLATAKEFKVFYNKIPTGSSYTMDHTAITYAFDPKGRLRLAIRHAQTAESVTADLRLLLDEA